MSTWSAPTGVPPIVGVAWLRRRIDGVVVCEVGSTMGGVDPRAEFEAGHVPGARLVDLDAVLARPASGTDGRHPLPTATDFARDLGALGVADDRVVVAYDRRGGALASRLVWMLRILGQPAAILDGGLGTWEETATGDDLERGPTAVEVVRRTPRPWPEDAVADADRVAASLAAGSVVIDSRERRRYLGEIEPIDAVAGHVPGARNLPFADNLGPEGRFRSVEELRDRFGSVAGDDTIVYCGSGVTACHNALALEHAGFALPRVFVASWSGWTADPDRPVATGDAP